MYYVCGILLLVKMLKGLYYCIYLKVSNIYKVSLFIIIYIYNILYNCFKCFSYDSKIIFYVLLFINSYIFMRFRDWFMWFGNWFMGEV